MATLRQKFDCCAGCGNEMKKTAVIFDFKGYCRKCYKKYFVAVPCDKCGKLTSSLNGIQPVTCKVCRSKGRKCLGCGHEIDDKRKVGKVTPEGVYCSSCSRQFRESQTCSQCGKETPFITRDFVSANGELLCNNCRFKSIKRTKCGGCGKRKKIYKEIDGKQICFTCAKELEPRICPRCGNPMKSSGAICSSCEYRQISLDKCEQMSQVIRQEWVRKLFRAFVNVYADECGGYLTNERIDRFLPIFVAIDKEYRLITDINLISLVRLFGGEFFRDNNLLYSFFLKQGIVVEETEFMRLDAIEIVNQENILKDAQSRWYGALFKEYYEYLIKMQNTYRELGWEGRKRRYIPSTITGYLKAARNFCDACEDINASSALTQDHFTYYISERKGSRYDISPFVRFMRRYRKIFARVVLPKRKRKDMSPDIFIQEDRINELLSIWLNPAEANLKESLIFLIMLFCIQRPRHIAMLKLDDIFKKAKGCYSLLFHDRIEIPPIMAEILNKYLEIRQTAALDDDNNDYLFPGNIRGSHISVNTIKDYLYKHGHTCEQIYATGIFRLIMNGVENHDVLISGFGVSPKTANKYLGMLNARSREDATYDPDCLSVPY